MSSSHVLDQTRAMRIARACLMLVGGMGVVDVAIVALLRLLGWTDVSLIPTPADAFADYFKFILSMPGGPTVPVSDLAGSGRLIAHYQLHPDYAGVDGLTTGRLTHLHVTPLTMAFCQVNLWLMAHVQPALLFATLMLGLAGWWVAVALHFARDRREGLFWASAGLCCYPAALVLLRGNIYAGITAMLVIQSMLMLLRRQGGVASAVMLALACSIRPNAIVFAIPLLFMTDRSRGRTVVWFICTGAVASVLSLRAAHLFYPDYSLTTFRAALRIYYDLYVLGDLGAGYGSSAYGALRMLLGYSPGLDRWALIPAALIGARTMALAWRGSLRPSSLMFLTAAVYTLGSTIFADYHLLPFLVPLMAVADEARNGPLDTRGRTILLASCLVLAPKNLISSDTESWQAVANPAILLLGAIQVLMLEWRARRGLPLAIPPIPLAA